MEKNEKEGSKTLDKTLAILVDQLRIVAAAHPPIAYQIVGPAAAIFDAWQKSRNNKAEYDALADEAIRLAYEVAIKQDNTESYMQANLTEFNRVLVQIRDYTEKCASRGRFKSFMLSSFDVGEIKMQRQKLERCMRLFQFQSFADLREKTDKLVQRVSDSNAKFNSPGLFAVGAGITSGGPARNITSKGNTIKNNFKFGDGADFSGGGGFAFGNDIHLNTKPDNSAKPQDSPATNSDNNTRTQDYMGANTAPSPSPRRSENGANSHANAHGNNERNTTTNTTTFGDNANLSAEGGVAIGSNIQMSTNSNNRTDNSLNVRNHGSNNVNVLNRGDNNNVHLGDNNSNNRGIIGGSGNTVNSGNNSGTQFFPHASNFSLSGGEFSNVMGNSVRNNYFGSNIPSQGNAMGVPS